MSTADRIVLIVELAVAVGLGLGFLVPYVARRTWRQSPWGWHMVAVTAVMVGEGVAFLLLLAGVTVPVLVFQVGFGLLDMVVGQRLWLFLRERETPRGRVHDVDG